MSKESVEVVDTKEGQVFANGIYIGNRTEFRQAQTSVEVFVIIQQIKQQELTSIQLDQLIDLLVDYKLTVDKQGSDLYHEEEKMKQEYIEESII